MTDPTPTGAGRLPSALDSSLSFGVVVRLLQSGAVFLDYDGTLTPIVARPELAILSDSVRHVLQRLAKICPIMIVTGRDVEDVSELVALDQLGYAGSHGLDIVGPSESGLRHQAAEGFEPELDAVEAELRRRTNGIEGVIVERKRFSISTHVRQVDPRWHTQVEKVVDDVSRTHPTLRREGGKMLYELRPDIAWDKGMAVRWFLDRVGVDPSMALYIGDDLTDETAFSALAGRGATVVVAEADDQHPTLAQFRLNDPGDVRLLLEGLVAHRSQA
jgi:trehalose 6-phosphate phosphatase